MQAVGQKSEAEKSECPMCPGPPRKLTNGRPTVNLADWLDCWIGLDWPIAPDCAPLAGWIVQAGIVNLANPA